jgi:hypothetical protein
MKSPQADAFIHQGYSKLEGFHPGKRMATIRQALLDELKRLKASRGSLPLQGLPIFQQIGKLSSLVKIPGLHESLVTTELIDCVTRLGGRRPPSKTPNCCYRPLARLTGRCKD